MRRIKIAIFSFIIEQRFIQTKEVVVATSSITDPLRVRMSAKQAVN